MPKLSGSCSGERRKVLPTKRKKRLFFNEKVFTPTTTSTFFYFLDLQVVVKVVGQIGWNLYVIHVCTAFLVAIRHWSWPHGRVSFLFLEIHT
jgi:hypothetical protein